MALKLGFQIAIAVVISGLLTSVPAHAECRTMSMPAGTAVRLGVRDSHGRVVKPVLVFSGTVTATDPEKYTVTFTISRVWQGELRRETTFVVAPVIEGAGVGSFKTGSTYLVTTYAPITVFGAEDAGATELRPGTVGISFGCIDGPVLLAEASKELKRLGRGRPPTP